MGLFRKLVRWLLKNKEVKRQRFNTKFYKLNLLKDPEDKRDEKYALMYPGVAIPDKCNLVGFPAVKNQGHIGSCASHAFATCVEYLCSKNDKAMDDLPLSELFHYYAVRQSGYMGTFPNDSGQYLRDGAKVLKDIGIAPEVTWVYDPAKFNAQPPNLAYTFANLWRISAYNRVWSLDSLKFAISQGKPVVFGITVASDCFNTQSDGELRFNGTISGGHALCATGYDDNRINANGSKGAIQFINSWGRSWGSYGYGWISYDNFRKNFMDAWTITVK